MKNEGKIFVVDDNLFINELIKKTLEQGGYINVQGYENGLLAYKAIEPGKIMPDLIITDYNMPEMDGLELLEKCAKKFSCILMTGNKEEVEQKALDLGAKLILEKPFKLRELTDAVNKYVK